LKTRDAETTSMQPKPQPDKRLYRLRRFKRNLFGLPVVIRLLALASY